MAQSLSAALTRHGVPVFYSPHNITGAQQWQNEILIALRRCDWFVVILSPNAINSMWVRREVAYALQDPRYEDHIIPLKSTPDFFNPSTTASTAAASISRTSRAVRRKHRRLFNVSFQRFQRSKNDFFTQARVQFRRQRRIAAGMRNTHAFDNSRRAHLLCYRIHRGHQRYGKTCFLEFFAHHSAAATTGTSRGYEEDALDVVFLQILSDFFADTAHHRRRALVAWDDIVGGIEFAGADNAFGL